MSEIAKGFMADDDRKRQVEEQVGKAVEALRQHMPDNFILVFEHGGGTQVQGVFSLESAQRMMKTAIEEVSHQYAYTTAKKAVER